MAMMLACVAPTTSVAQSSGAPRREVLSIDQWVSNPTPIRMTDTQQKTIDSLRVDYKKDLDKVRRETKGGDEVGSVRAMGILDAKYRRIVRARLTADQRKIFDANTHSRGEDG